MNSTKTEKRAILALENIIINHKLMDYQFNYNDKGMSWDGFISLHKSENINKKSDHLDSVPVQIKGTVNDKLIKKSTIHFKTDIDDLYNYYRSRGVLYFVIVISNDLKKQEIYYNSLFPSKLKSIISIIEKKGNKKNYNLKLIKLNKNVDEMYKIVSQFSFESIKQGFGIGELVNNTIPLREIENLVELKATIKVGKSEFDFIEGLGSGDICVYGKRNENDIYLPVEYSEKCKSIIKKNINIPIVINNKCYYEKYCISYSSDKELIIIPSENIKFNLTKKTFKYRLNSTLKELENDVSFLQALLDNKCIEIGNAKIEDIEINKSNDIIKYIRFIKDLSEIFKMLKIDFVEYFKDLIEEDLKQLEYIVKIFRNKESKLLNNSVVFYNLKINNKYISMIIIKQNNKIAFENVFSTDKHQASISNLENNCSYKVPLFIELQKEKIAKAYDLPIDKMIKQIETSDVNEYTCEKLNLLALNLIGAFDTNKNKNLLELAYKIYEKLIRYDSKNNYYKVNIYQLRKRKGTFNKSDEVEILKLLKEEKELSMICAYNILLGNHIDLEKNLSIMSENDKDIFTNYPIYELYLMEKNCFLDDKEIAIDIQ